MNSLCFTPARSESLAIISLQVRGIRMPTCHEKWKLLKKYLNENGKCIKATRAQCHPIYNDLWGGFSFVHIAFDPSFIMYYGGNKSWCDVYVLSACSYTSLFVNYFNVVDDVPNDLVFFLLVHIPRKLFVIIYLYLSSFSGRYWLSSCILTIFQLNFHSLTWINCEIM